VAIEGRAVHIHNIAEIILKISFAEEKYSPSLPSTALLKILSWAAILQPQAIASSSEGLVPPTEWPWKYIFEKNRRLLIVLLS
jgi:hypothetical protein